MLSSRAFSVTAALERPNSGWRVALANIEWLLTGLQNTEKAQMISKEIVKDEIDSERLRRD